VQVLFLAALHNNNNMKMQQASKLRQMWAEVTPYAAALAGICYCRLIERNPVYKTFFLQQSIAVRSQQVANATNWFMTQQNVFASMQQLYQILYALHEGLPITQRDWIAISNELMPPLATVYADAWNEEKRVIWKTFFRSIAQAGKHLKVAEVIA
jgi:hypothetical protein